MNNIVTIQLSILMTFFTGGVTAFADVAPRDSLVTFDSEGNETIEYVYPKKEPVIASGSHAVAFQARTLDKVYTEEAVLSKQQMLCQSSARTRETVKQNIKSGNLPVASIPCQEGMTPSGARTYTIPISVASGYRLAPQLNLSYNSQTGVGTAGYGWNLAGIPSITIRNKNLFYDDIIEAAKYVARDGVYSLDGMPLLSCDMGISGYSLKTSQGNILVGRHSNAVGMTAYFTALYPDGSKATFGYTNNTQPRISYPLTKLEDRFGNKIEFEYELENSYYYLKSVRYGKDAVIAIEYEPLKSYRSSAYYAGQNTFLCKELKNITSSDGKTVAYRYELTHQDMSGVSMLTKLGCVINGTEIPSLFFSYGENENTYTDGFTLTDDIYLMKYFKKENGNDEITYVRGKFISGRYDDGVIMLPSRATYALLGKKFFFSGWHRWYGTAYAEDQEILCYPRVELGAEPEIITTEAGFQLLEAIDVNNDGVDELVKLNYTGADKSSTSYKLTIYSFDKSTYKININRTIEFTIADQNSNKKYNSPARSWFRFGNFGGDGNMKLLVMSEKNSRFALVDLTSGTKLSETSLYSMGEDEENLTLAMDFENDGKTDLCHITDEGMDVYTLSTTASKEFTKRTTYTGVSKNSLYKESNIGGIITDNPESRLYCADMNGDGYTDLVAVPDAYKDDKDVEHKYASIHIALFTGNGFVQHSNVLDTRGTDDVILLFDVNKDGLPELLHLKDQSSGSQADLFKNEDGQLARFSYYVGMKLADNADLVPCNVSSFSDMSDILVVSGAYIKKYAYNINCRKNRLLTQFSDGYGNTQYNSYSDVSLSEGAYLPYPSGNYSNSKGFLCYRSPMPVLFGTRSVSEGKDFINEYYTYYDAVYNNRGLGFCGFKQIRKIDYIPEKNVTTITVNDPENFGVPVSTEQQISGKSIFMYSYTYNKGSGLKYIENIPMLTASMEYDYLTAHRTMCSYTYDNYGFPLEQTTTEVTSGTPEHPVMEQIQIVSAKTYSHKKDASLYILGNLVSEYVKRTNTEKETVSERKTSVYDSDSFLPIDVCSYINNNIVSEVKAEYDKYGNLISEITSLYGTDAFLQKNYEYDSDGRYLISATDEFGHKTTYEEYNVFGNPCKITDHKGRIKSVVYDGLGNETNVHYPDGSEKTTTLSYGGNWKYFVETHLTGAPKSVIHYDALGREVCREQERYDGSMLYSYIHYDAQGRIEKESLPARADGAPLYTVYTYDEYGRRLSASESGGKNTTWKYEGERTTAVKDGISSTAETGLSDLVRSVTDAGGTIYYSYYPDGNIKTVSAPGNVMTSFEYDSYGRRTKIIDPSAGVQATSFLYNTDGSSLTVETNPNGMIKTYRDKYGRIVKIDRPGEYSTSYIYDSDGLLIKEESTNGTAKYYEYDTFDRLVFLKEVVPDGKWLQKEYTYCTGGVLSTIKYTSQSGEIATEIYSYSHGHNVQIALTSGQIVWKLEAENELGQPIAGKTGNMERTYSFSPNGIPTKRTMGDVMDMSYVFNPENDNLNSRVNNLHPEAHETFSYDNLGRLVRMNMTSVNYIDKGNIGFKGSTVMYYDDAEHPYQMTAIDTDEEPADVQSISYTCYRRPSRLEENGRIAAFTYNGDGDRVKMIIANGVSQILVRYYMGGQYELDLKGGKETERLYLGGDYYSSPMVYVKEGKGSQWVPYNIGRDYLGSITHVADYDGALVAEYSYDAWGRLRNPETLEVYAKGEEPALIIGDRGYTGHEHLIWFGLINMNARLYDPVTGRFLSPDPYVQRPDFTQNFNRYAYALNNPLKYMDQDGESITAAILIGAAIIGGVINLISNRKRINGFWQGFTTFASGALAGVGVAGAGIFSGGYGWIALAGAGGGALTSFNNSIVAQTGKNFAGWSDIDWNQVGSSVASGSLAGAASAVVGKGVVQLMPLCINGTALNSPFLKTAIASPLSAATGHVIGGTVYGICDGMSLKDAFYASFNGIVKSMLQGLTLGTISTTLTCMYFGINPLTGTKMWPKNLGFLNEPSERMLEKGTILDRYGKPTEGRFLSPEGTDFESRSLPSYIKTAEYTRYMVNKPFPVSEGQAAPFYWFNSSGGGTQYYLKNDISYYIEKGYIKIIK